MNTKTLRVLKSEKVYDDGETILKVHCRDEENNYDERYITGYNPRFYAPSDEVSAVKDTLQYDKHVRNIHDGYESLKGNEVACIEVQPSQQVTELRDMFDSHYGADVWYTNRVRLDLDIKSGIRVPANKDKVHYKEVEPVEYAEPDHRIVTFDIEVDDREGVAQWEDPEQGILSIVAHDSFTDEVVGWFDTGGRSMEDCFPSMVDQLPDGVDTFADADSDTLAALDPPGDIDQLHCRENERQMLIDFACWISGQNPDVLTGWYSNDFDLPYLISRMKQVDVNPNRMARGEDGRAFVSESWNGVTPRIEGRLCYDLLPAYKSTKFSELPSYRLEDVAQREVGKGKVELEGEGYGVYDAYKNDPETLLKYNAQDTILTWRVNEEAGVIPFKERLATHELVGCELDQTTNPSDIIEFAVRRRLNDWGIVGPSRDPPEDSEEYEGAHVVDAHHGVAGNVFAIDLDSLYPNNLAMFNMSPETKLSDIEADMLDVPYVEGPNGTKFRTDEQGLVSGLVDELLDLKSGLKQRLKEIDSASEEYEVLEEEYNVTKVIVNSLYGVIGWDQFFLYDEEVAEECTLAGQEVIKKTQHFIDNETAGEVIYGDTDSNYVQFPESWDAEKCVKVSKEISDELNEVVYPRFATNFDINPEDCRWSIEPEMYASRFLQTGQKKFYAYLVVWDDGTWLDKPKVKVKGYQCIKSNFAELTKEVQRNVIESILHDEPNTVIAGHLQDGAAQISQGLKDWEKIGIPQGLGQDLDKYNWTNGSPQDAHPRGAYNANQILDTDYGSGNKPKRVYLDEKRSPGGIDVIAFESNSDLDGHRGDLHIDIQRMVDKEVITPNEELCKAVGIDPNAALKGQTQSSLGSFA